MRYKSLVILTTCIILFGFTTSLCAQTRKPVPAKKAETVAIDEVLKVVGKALTEAQNNNPEGFPPLKSVELTLSTVTSKEAGGGLSILVFKIGSEIVGEEASTIKLTMEPPPTTTKEVEKGRALDPNEYKMALAAALNISKEAVLSAKQHLPLLITSEIEIEVAFTVKKNAEGGISISPIGIGELTVGANIGGKLSKSQVHKLKLLFSKGK